MTATTQKTTQKVLLTARFSEVVAVNFQIDPRILEPRVPRGLELDFYKNETYVSLVAMMLRDVRVWGIPIHIATGFGEFNLRFYVRRKDGNAQQRGACFIKDYVSSGAAAWILGSLFKADFHKIKMQNENVGFTGDKDAIPSVDYRWKVDDHWNRLRIKARGLVKKTGPDTKVGFILDHANQYSSRKGQTLEYQGTKPTWTVWDAAQANFTCDVKKLFGQEFVRPLSKRPASVFVASGSDVTIHKPVSLV